MPSPFPGMDPFLEHPDFFPDLHGSLNVYVREALQASLPEPYFAVINERLWVEAGKRIVEPDVDVVRGGEAGRGGVAVAAPARSTPLVIRVPMQRIRQKFVEIRMRHKTDGERVVTSIEILRPSNKSRSGRGREEYLRKQREVLNSDSRNVGFGRDGMRKQREVLASDVHLVEIDLLRGGEHTTAVPLARLKKRAGSFDYHICVHRFETIDEFHVYPFRLEDPLPEIAVPLLPGDGDVRVDLQQVFNRAYDSGPYRRRVPYDPRALVPALSAKRLTWVRQQLKRTP